MNLSTPGLPVHHHLPEFTQTHVHRVGDAIQPSYPLSSPFHLPPIPLSIRVFSNESTLCIRWPKYWSFSFSIIPSKEHPGLISLRMDWLDLLAVHGTLKSLLQHHSSKASILRCSAFFRVKLSHPYVTTGKTIALTRRTFVVKVMSLLFNMLSRLVITFLPKSKHLLISWLRGGLSQGSTMCFIFSHLYMGKGEEGSTWGSYYQGSKLCTLLLPTSCNQTQSHSTIPALKKAAKCAFYIWSRRKNGIYDHRESFL